MKLLIVLWAVCHLGSAEYYIPTYNASTERELCDILRWAAGARDACLIAMLDEKHPGSWKNSNTCEMDRTFLHFAVQKGDVQSVMMLLALGLDLEAMDDLGRTPLFYAVNGTSTTLGALLLYAGAEVNVADNEGNTPLHMAVINHLQSSQSHGDGVEQCMRTQTHVVRLLMAGANRSTENTDGFSPISLAAKEGAYITGLLLGNIKISNGIFRSNLEDLCSAWAGHHREVYKTHNFPRMDQSRTENGKDWCGRTELFFGEWGPQGMGGSRKPQRPLDKSIINERDRRSLTSLHMALMRTPVNFGWVDFLIKRGADLNARDWLGQTPLHIAVMCGEGSVDYQLRQFGADTSIRDNLNRSPRDLRGDTIFRPRSTLSASA